MIQRRLRLDPDVAGTESCSTVIPSEAIRSRAGPSGPKNPPPERAPDHSVTYQTTKDQALLYRLSGDRNPLHSDPTFAEMAGFPTPILHGLCTYGFTGRALLHTLCESDPSRFKSIDGRFSSPVFPSTFLAPPT